jgi:hypothetical protein
LIILKAGLTSGHYLVIAALALFVGVAFCAVMFHVNCMVFGTPEPGTAALVMPGSCKATLALAAIPLIVIGLYVPAPLQDLLRAAGAAMGG